MIFVQCFYVGGQGFAPVKGIIHRLVVPLQGHNGSLVSTPWACKLSQGKKMSGLVYDLLGGVGSEYVSGFINDHGKPQSAAKDKNK